MGTSETFIEGCTCSTVPTVSNFLCGRKMSDVVAYGGGKLNRMQELRRARAAGTIARNVGKWIWRNRQGIARQARVMYNRFGPDVRRRLAQLGPGKRSLRGPARNRAYSVATNATATGSKPSSSVRVISSGKRRRGFKRKTRKYKSVNKLLWKRICTPQTVKSTWAYALAGKQGQRQWMPMMMGSLGQIQAEVAARRPTGFLTAGQRGSASIQTIFEYGQQNWQAVIQSLVYDTRIQNRSNATMELKIYECAMRHDVPSGSLNAQTGFLSMFSRDMDNPTFVGSGNSNQGPNQENLPTGITNNYYHPAFTPYMSNEFVNTFKILKTHRVNLGPNEVLHKKFYCKKNATFKGQYIDGATSTFWQKNYTKYLLFSWVGQPVDDGTVVKQTKARCDLFIQSDITMKFHFWPGEEPLYNISYSPANFVGGTTNQYKLNAADIAAPVIGASEVVENVTGEDEVPVEQEG